MGVWAKMVAVRSVFLSLVIIIVCCLAINAPAQAAEKKEEWKADRFDFRKIKAVPLEIQFDEKLDEDMIRDLRINSMIDSLLVQDLQQKLRMAGYTIIKQPVDQPLDYNAKLVVFIRQFGEKEVWVSETRRFETTTKVIEVEETTYDRNGRATKKVKKVKVPETREIITPAHYQTWTMAGAELRLLEANGNPVWLLVDLRDSSDGHESYGMLERILNRSIDKLVELKKL